MNNTDAQLAEELAKYYADPLGYVMFAFPWDSDKSIQLVDLPEKYKSRFPNIKYGPDLWACEFLEDVGKAVKERGFNGKDAVVPIRFSTASGHGIGKLQLKTDFVPTPAGKKLVSSIKAGDYLFGENGQPVLVLATKEWKDIPIYRVTFDDKSSVCVGDNHLWKVRGRQDRRLDIGWQVLSTKAILNAGVKRPNGVRLARQWEIPNNKKVAYTASCPDLDPYTYGVWLGDGTKQDGRITNVDSEVWQNIPYLTGPLYKGSTATVHGLVTKLKALGLFGCTTYNASVDRRYVESKDRLAVLQGLLDTDGWVEACGAAAFASASRQLTKDVIEIARSLGLKAREEKFQKNNCAGSWRTLITWDGETKLFRVLRKQEKLVYPSQSRYLSRWIDKIEYVGNDDGICFEVVDGLYQTDQFQVTHNSALVAWLVKWILDTRPLSVGTVTANTAEQLKTKTWAEVGKWHHMSITSHWFDYSSGRGAMSLIYKNRKLKWRCDAQTCREENSEAFAGQHAPNSSSFYIFDEASNIPAKIYEVREGGLTDGEPMLFDFGNPTRNSGNFYENCVGRFSHRYNTRSIDARNVAITNKHQHDEWIKDYGIDSDFVKVRILGKFPSASSVQFIPTEDVEIAMSRQAVPDKDMPLLIGVDVARFGSNSSVIWPRIGRDAKSFYPKKFNGLDTTQLTGKVIEEVLFFKNFGRRVHTIFVDGGGIGGGVVDQLRSLGYPVVEVNFGGRAVDSTYRFKGDEIWGKMRQAIKDGLALPDFTSPLGREIFSDLTQREYGYTLGMKLHLESKEDMEKRGLESPDLADALALTYAQEIAANVVGVTGTPNWCQHEYDPYDVKRLS